MTFPSNNTPAWKSWLTTGNRSDIVPSTTVATAIGAKVDATSGQSLDQTLETPTITGGSASGTDISAADLSADMTGAQAASAITSLNSVITLGAVADGTTDCTTVFQKCVTDGGTYFVPSGKYLITDSSIIMSDAAHFIGPGEFVYGSNIIPAGDFISSDLTLVVPDVFPQPNNALGYLNNRRFGDGVIITIHIPDGTYTEWAVTLPNHPQGDQIQLIGNTTDRSNVIIQIDQTNAGKFLYVSNSRFGLVNGMSVEGSVGWTSSGVWDTSITPYGGAVWCDQGGTCTVGSLFFSEKMYYGIRADHGSVILVQQNALVNEYGDVGYHAYEGGIIAAPNTFADTGGDTAASLGAGYLAEAGGIIHCELANTAHANMYGVGAISNGTVWGQGIVSSYAGKFAAFAANGGHGIYITANGEQSDFGYSTIGVRAQMGASIELGGAKVHNNSSDGVSASSASIDFSGGISNSNSGAGAIARYNGVIYGTWTSTSNTDADSAVTGGIINATAAL